MKDTHTEISVPGRADTAENDGIDVKYVGRRRLLAIINSSLGDSSLEGCA